jgi:hypothetical protein
MTQSSCIRRLLIKSYFFWDITPCNPLKFSRGFGGISTDYTALYLRRTIHNHRYENFIAYDIVDVKYDVVLWVRKAENLTAVCEPIVRKMWEHRRLTNL